MFEVCSGIRFAVYGVCFPSDCQCSLMDQGLVHRSALFVTITYCTIVSDPVLCNYTPPVAPYSEFNSDIFDTFNGLTNQR